LVTVYLDLNYGKKLFSPYRIGCCKRIPFKTYIKKKNNFYF